MQFANNEILDVTLQNDIMLIKMSQKVIGWTRAVPRLLQVGGAETKISEWKTKSPNIFPFLHYFLSLL